MLEASVYMSFRSRCSMRLPSCHDLDRSIVRRR
jgi:hypothetical protein